MDITLSHMLLIAYAVILRYRLYLARSQCRRLEALVGDHYRSIDAARDTIRDLRRFQTVVECVVDDATMRGIHRELQPIEIL